TDLSRAKMAQLTGSIGRASRAITAWPSSSNRSTRFCGDEKLTTWFCVLRKKDRRRQTWATSRTTRFLGSRQRELPRDSSLLDNRSRNSPNVCAHRKVKTDA